MSPTQWTEPCAACTCLTLVGLTGGWPSRLVSWVKGINVIGTIEEEILVVVSVTRVPPEGLQAETSPSNILPRALIVHGKGKPIGSDVLVPTEGVETSCGHLILNTAGLENGKCQDLSHVCMGWEMCVCMDLAFLCLVMFFCEIMKRSVWHHLASHLVHMVQNNSKVLFPWQYLLDDDNPRSPSFSCYKCKTCFRDFSKFKKSVKYLFSCCL